MKKIKIGHDQQKERAFNQRAESKKNVFLDVLSYVNTFDGINIPTDKFPILRTHFCECIKKKYCDQYPGISDYTLFSLLGVDLDKLRELEDNFNQHDIEIDIHGNPLQYPDFSIYAENENEIMVLNALENILTSLKVLRQSNRTILIGELNNALFGAYEINLNSMQIIPKTEYIKNVNFAQRRGNPRLKL
jgi:hypothetical protein